MWLTTLRIADPAALEWSIGPMCCRFEPPLTELGSGLHDFFVRHGGHGILASVPTFVKLFGMSG